MKSDRFELIRLLLELHSDYFLKKASTEIKELTQEKNIVKSYEEYLDRLEQCDDNTWKILLAKTAEDKTIGFIIGSTETDNQLVLSKIGRLEDWYVESKFRGQSIGLNLYNELERWFRENGCQQIHSDTWYGNELSVKAHRQSGFFISSIGFSKKL